MNGGGLETGRLAPAIARKGHVPGLGMGLVCNRGREVMGNAPGGPSEGGQPVTGGLVAEPPLRAMVLVVTSEMGWFEVYGDLDVDIAYVTHRRGEDDEQLARRVPWRHRELLVGRYVQAGDAQITLRKPPKGNGWLDQGRPEVSRLVMHERLSELVARYGYAMDTHPLLWLDGLAAAAGMEPLDMLHALLRAGREKDAATKKNAAQGQGRAAKNSPQAKAKEAR